MDELFAVNALMLKHYLILSLWVTFAMGLLRLAGSSFGPLIKRDWPRVYTWLAATYAFLSAAVNDLFALLAKETPAAPPGAGVGLTKLPPPPSSTAGPVAPSLRRLMFDGAVRMTLVALMLFASSCSAAQSATVSTGASGTVTPDGTLTWQVGVSVAIQFARATIPPGLRSALESQPGVSADQRAAIDRGTALTGDSLALLGTGWDSYVHHPTGPALCQAHVYLENAIASALQTLQMLKDAGVPIPPIVAAAVGGLGPAADMLLPPCGGVTARRLSATDSIRAHLEHLGSR